MIALIKNKQLQTDTDTKIFWAQFMVKKFWGWGKCLIWYNEKHCDDDNGDDDGDDEEEDENKDEDEDDHDPRNPSPSQP